MGHALVECGRIGNQLERRAGLVDVADRMILQQRRSGVPKLVRIERWPNCERENLAGMHVLHDDSAIVGVGLLHVVIESALGHELDVFVDRELQILTRLWLMSD